MLHIGHSTIKCQLAGTKTKWQVNIHNKKNKNNKKKKTNKKTTGEK